MVGKVLGNVRALLFTLALGHSSSAFAFTWSEVGDAGHLPAYASGFAQEPTGASALSAIAGTWTPTAMSMYKIFIAH